MVPGVALTPPADMALPRGLEPLSCGFGDRCVSITPRQQEKKHSFIGPGRVTDYLIGLPPDRPSLYRKNLLCLVLRTGVEPVLHP